MELSFLFQFTSAIIVFIHFNNVQSTHWGHTRNHSAQKSMNCFKWPRAIRCIERSTFIQLNSTFHVLPFFPRFHNRAAATVDADVVVVDLFAVAFIPNERCVPVFCLNEFDFGCFVHSVAMLFWILFWFHWQRQTNSHSLRFTWNSQPKSICTVCPPNEHTHTEWQSKIESSRMHSRDFKRNAKVVFTQNWPLPSGWWWWHHESNWVFGCKFN